MADITQRYVRVEIAKQILADINAFAVAKWHDPYRSHLGASLIGQECSRKIWYGWRWMAKPKGDGRMQRLFQRGHLEEYRYIEYLEGIGAQIWPHDPNLPLKNGEPQQWKVSKLGGHFGGSLDGIVQLPERYGIPFPLLAEFKTKGTGAGFAKLTKDGIQLTGPQHFDQMSTYGYNYNLHYAAYFSTNKNDDDMHVEIVPLDFKRAVEIEQKAHYIITQTAPPPRVSLNPTFWLCKNCDFRTICHENHVPAKNCRSCVYSQPTDNAQWYCTGHKGVIPDSVIREGCPQWAFIPSQPG